jgi:hypothetical protein
MDARTTAAIFVIGVPAACVLIVFGAIVWSLVRGKPRR